MSIDTTVEALCQHTSPSGAPCCSRLEDAGYGVGLRLLEALSYRERGSRREVRLIEMLKFVHTTLWKCLFGRQARELEQSNTVGWCSSIACFPLNSPQNSHIKSHMADLFTGRR